jgi:Dickkopf-like protein
MVRRALAACVFVALLVAGCKGKAGGGGNGCDTPTPYCQVLGALCDVLDRCPNASAYPIAYRSHDECVQILSFLSTCRLKSEEVGRMHVFHLEQMTPKIDAEPAQACAAWLEKASCDAVSQDAPLGKKDTPCDLIVVKDEGDSSAAGAAAGESCEMVECADDLYCTSQMFLPAEHALTCPICTPLPIAGQDCRISSGRCAKGFYCQGSQTSTAATCFAVLSPSSPCTGGDQCASGFCNANSMQCDPAGEEGDPCANTKDCRTPGFCDTAAGRCAKLRENGQPCAASDQCVNSNCDVATGTCGMPEGAGCANGGDSVCASKWCDPTMMKCASPKANGEACRSNDECQSGFCTFNGKICAIECHEDQDCPSGQACMLSDDACVAGAPPKPKIGDPCTSTEQCLPLGYCSGKTCLARKAPGESCDSIESCRDPFLCLNGTCQPMFLECRGAPVGSLCTYLRVCDGDGYCEIPSFTCKPAAQKGESCMSKPCVASAFCDPTSNTCVDQADEGAPCQSVSQCKQGLYCAETARGQICTAGPEGKPCSYGPRDCPAGLFCSTDEGVCHFPLPVGAHCDSSAECMPNLYCITGRGPGSGCQPRPELGGACWTDVPCADGFYCDLDSRKCKADAIAGEMCNDNPPFGIECIAGYYCAFDLTTRTQSCAPQRQAGEPCQEDRECASGACHYDSGAYACLATAQCIKR